MRQASLIAYAGWKVLGIYPKVMEKTNLHPVSVGPFCGCVTLGFEGFNRGMQPQRLISVSTMNMKVFFRFSETGRCVVLVFV